MPDASSDLAVQLVSDSDGLDADVLRRHTAAVRMRAEVCRRQGIADGRFDDALIATITVSMTPRGLRRVHVSGADGISDCLSRMFVGGDLPLGASLTFQVTFPAP